MRAAARWDAYAHVETPAVHWVALFNSLAGVVLLTVAVGVITKHALSKFIGSTPCYHDVYFYSNQVNCTPFTHVSLSLSTYPFPHILIVLFVYF